MLYVVVVLVVAVVSVLLVMFSPAPLQLTISSVVPVLGGRTLDTSLWLLIAASALGGAFLTWLSGLSQARRMGSRMKKLEGMVRKAKDAIAERDETITQYEEQLIELGVMERPQEEAPEGESSEPQPEDSDEADTEAAPSEEEKR